MLYRHSCGHPVWMEMQHVGGSADVPCFWDQRPIHRDSIKSCPGCKAALPGSLTDHIRAVDDKKLVVGGGVN